jgi:tetratricopeptide (TPR) repeat protein
MNKDTVNALKTVTNGIAAYPENSDLRKRQIELYLKTGKQQEVLNQIQTAIDKDPKNKELYYYAGITYSQLAENINAEQLKTKDAAAKAKLQSAKLENFSKSTDMYKKALAIDPEFFEANLNLGYTLISPAIDMYNAANQLPTNKQKEYDAAIAKANEQFELAKPYLLKAVELNPKSADALSNLKTYYRAKNDMTNANAIQKRIDALQ